MSVLLTHVGLKKCVCQVFGDVWFGMIPTDTFNISALNIPVVSCVGVG